MLAAENGTTSVTGAMRKIKSQTNIPAIAIFSGLYIMSLQSQQGLFMGIHLWII